MPERCRAIPTHAASFADSANQIKLLSSRREAFVRIDNNKDWMMGQVVELLEIRS